MSNGKSAWETAEEEKQTRQETTEDQLRVYRSVLPRLWKRLGKIPDPRNPLLIRHKLVVLLLYGILLFVFQMASRRASNREMSLPLFLQNLRLLFPELESLPHADTLNRLLARIDANQIQESLLALVQQLIRQKKFAGYLISHGYPIAIDGTQKLQRDRLWAEQCLERQVQTKKEAGPWGPGRSITFTFWKLGWLLATEYRGRSQLERQNQHHRFTIPTHNGETWWPLVAIHGCRPVTSPPRQAQRPLIKPPGSAGCVTRSVNSTTVA